MLDLVDNTGVVQNSDNSLFGSYFSKFGTVSALLDLKVALRNDSSMSSAVRKEQKKSAGREFRQQRIDSAAEYDKQQMTIGSDAAAELSKLQSVLTRGSVPAGSTVIIADPALAVAGAVAGTLVHQVDITDIVDTPAGQLFPYVHIEASAGDTVQLKYNGGDVASATFEEDPDVEGALQFAGGKKAGGGQTLVTVASVATGRTVNIQLAYSASGGIGGDEAPAAGAGSGDPYIQPYRLGGRMAKLPDREQCYRLLDAGGLQLNARVGRLGAAGQEQISARFGQLAVTSGFFFREFVVRTPKSVVHFDGDLNILSCVLGGDLRFGKDPNTRSYICPVQGPLRFRSIWLGLPGKCGIELRKFSNPQVRNGAAIRFLSEPEHARGLLVDGRDRAARLKRHSVTDFRPLQQRRATTRARGGRGVRSCPAETWVTTK